MTVMVLFLIRNAHRFEAILMATHNPVFVNDLNLLRMSG